MNHDGQVKERKYDNLLDDEAHCIQPGGAEFSAGRAVSSLLFYQGSRSLSLWPANRFPVPGGRSAGCRFPAAL